MNKIRILAVDDNKSLIEMIKEYFKDNSEGAWRFNRIAFILIGAFLLVYVFVKSFMFFMIPNPLLETVLLVLLAILLVKKGMDLKLR